MRFTESIAFSNHFPNESFIPGGIGGRDRGVVVGGGGGVGGSVGGGGGGEG